MKNLAYFFVCIFVVLMAISFSFLPGCDRNSDGNGEVSVKISGYVRDSENHGQGIPGVQIHFTNNGGTTTTDMDGYYSLSLRSGWRGSIIAVHENYQFTPKYSPQPIPVASDKSLDFNATLTETPNATIYGRVTRIGTPDIGVDGVQISFKISKQ